MKQLSIDSKFTSKLVENIREGLQSTDIRSVLVVYSKTEQASKTLRKNQNTQLPIEDGRSHTVCNQSQSLTHDLVSAEHGIGPNVIP